MIIIAESGATKTAWKSVDDHGHVRSVKTGGMSPTCLDPEHIQSVVREAIPLLNPVGSHVDAVYFYGAGLVSEEVAAPIRYALEMWCPFAQMHFHSDLLAAARALFGDGEGVVAIMGTGSNSCMYSGGMTHTRFYSGGFIIGDEGSGSALGKALVADYIKGLLPQEVAQAFDQKYSLDYQQIVRKVYREPGAAAFLASFAPFVFEHIGEPTGHMESLLNDCLESFVKRVLARYSDGSGTPVKVGVVGSFGCVCQDRLRAIGSRYGVEFVKFVKSPIEELVRYHGI